MSRRVNVFSALFLLLAGTGACLKPSGKQAETTTVRIPQTESKSQGDVGFCWSYSLHGMVESWALLNKGITVDLSEEALGFYWIAEEIFAKTQRVDGNQLAQEFAACGISQGATLERAVALLNKYGVVREEEWNAKFGGRWDSLKVDEVMAKIKEKAIEYAKGKKAGEISLDDVITKIMIDPSGFSALPPKEIVVLEGGQKRNFTPQQYLKDYLGFDATSFKEFQARDNRAALFSAIKRSLSRGYSVPILLPVFSKMEDRYILGNSKPAAGQNLSASGAHVVLISDLVNRGGYPGAYNIDEIKAEMAKSLDELSYLIVKNSYGLESSGNLTPGMFMVDKNYLEEALKGPLTVLVPEDIAKNPLAVEPINPKIAVTTGGNDDISGDLYEAEIKMGIAKGLFKGFADGSFRPQKWVTREQSAAMLVGMLTKIPSLKITFPAKVEKSPFTDVAKDRWSAPLLAFAKEKGIINGNTDGTFGLEKPASRAEIITMARKTAEFAYGVSGKGFKLPVQPAVYVPFRDAAKHWSIETVKLMLAFCGTAVSMNNNDNVFAPDAQSLRNDVAAVTVRTHRCLTEVHPL